MDWRNTSTPSENHERVAGLHRARIEIDAQIRNRDPVLAVGGKVVPEPRAAARAQRQPVDVGGLVAVWNRIMSARRLGRRFADGQARCQPRGSDVLIEERRRDAQGSGDVFEALHFDLSG